MLGVKPELLEQLVRGVNDFADQKLRQMILFALKCSRNPQSLTDADYAKLYALGISQSGAVELIAMSALAVYANIIADATGMDADDMFETI